MSNSILERIKKLLRLADSTKNNNVHQVNEALKKAHELMRKHNIDSQSIDISSPDLNIVDKERIILDATYAYIKTLAMASALLTSCHCFSDRLGSKHVMYFTGTKDDRGLAIEIFNWLNATTAFSAKRELGKGFTKDHRCFCDGFSNSIWHNAKILQTTKTESNEEDKKYDLIVVGKKDAIITYYEKIKMSFVTKPTRKTTFRQDVYSLGQREGNKVNLTGFKKSLNA